MHAVLGLATALGIVGASLGYGLFCLRVLRAGEPRPPLAVIAAAGLALITALGGWLVAGGVYSRGASLALLGLGLLALARLARDLRPAPGAAARPDFIALGFALLAGALFSVRCLGSTRSPFVNPCDDWTAYFHLPKLLLESGGLIEPFSMRRLGVLGAGPLLQTWFQPFWPTRAAAVADAVLGGLAVWGAARAAVELGAPRTRRGVELAGLAASVLSLSIPLANSSPALLPMGGALVLLYLAALLERGTASARAGHAFAVLWGAVAALVVGLRTSNLAFAGLIGLTGLVLALARRDAAAIRRWLLGALAFLLALAPWSIASWRSSATPLWPLIQGHYRFESLLSAPLSPAETLAFVASCLWASRLWFPLILALAVGCAPGWAGTAAIAAASAVGTVAATGFAFTASDSFNVFRYCAPFLVAVSAFLGALWLSGLRCAASPPRTGRLAPAFLALAAAVWVFAPVEVETHSANDEGRGPKRFGSSPARGIERSARGFWFAAGGALRSGLEEPLVAGAQHFAAVQAQLPSDARILSAVSKPFHWRFDRQQVHTLDCPGQASPPPGMPFFQGPDALAAYLRGLGYTHLAFTPPLLDPCLYSLENWRTARRSGVFLWESWAPYFLDFLENEQQLAQRLGTQYRSRDLVVVDLRDAPGGAPGEEP